MDIFISILPRFTFSNSPRVALNGLNNNSYNASKLQSSAPDVRPGSGEGQTSQGVVMPRASRELGAAFMSVLVTWSSLQIPHTFLQLSWLCDLMSVAGLVVIGGVWYSDDYSNPLLSWWESADTPGLSSPPLALNMCKQNICMANIAHTNNATSFFPAT